MRPRLGVGGRSSSGACASLSWVKLCGVRSSTVGLAWRSTNHMGVIPGRGPLVTGLPEIST